MRFEFLWQVLAKNALGLVVLTDNSRPDPLQDLAVYIDGFGKQLDTMPCVVGVGRLDSHASPSLDDYSAFLQARGLVLPILATDVRIREDVVLLIDVLLSQLEGFMLMEGR